MFRLFVFLSACFLLSPLHAQFDCMNMVQLGRFNPDLPDLSGRQKFNDVWGWYDSAKNREYAIVGSIDSIYFIEVTLNTPVVRAVKAGRSGPTTWRDLETYEHYCYAAQDGIPGSLQIFDLQYLPDSVHTVYDSDSLLAMCHTLFRADDKLFCNIAKRKNIAITASLIFSLADPEKPNVAGVVVPPIIDGAPAFNYCHDVYVRNDTLYCSGESSGLFIYDISNVANPTLRGVLKDYPEKGYNHSSWLTGDGKYLFFTDENGGLGIKVLKITDLNNLDVVKIFRSHTGAIAHNPYIRGNHLYVSYYEDGVYVFDINDPEDPKVLAYFDTYPANAPGSYHGFNGCWATYPFLPSGRILALDQTYGLFVLGVDENLSTGKLPGVAKFLAYPNPFIEDFQVSLQPYPGKDADVFIYDALGREVFHTMVQSKDGGIYAKINPLLPQGSYTLKISGVNTHLCRTLIKL